MALNVTDHTLKAVLVDDEELARGYLRELLASHPEILVVAECANGFDAVKAIAETNPDILFLDVQMPKLDGFAVCAELRRLEISVPVLMLTAKGQVEDRVSGLDAGADDYLVKPFSTEELLARVRALLRRTVKRGHVPTRLKLGDANIDLARQTATRGRKEIHLTAKEFSMLRLMAEAAGEPISREKFLDIVWGYASFPTTRTVDNHIASLRSKLEKNPDVPRWLKTVHGVGYKLDI